MSEEMRPQSRYMPGLDGLRTLAVLAVIAYHLDLGWAQGGLLGVGVFFVLSGYLITGQLLGALEHNRRIDLKDFWIRRFRRLLPAMLVMLMFVAIWLLLFDAERLRTVSGDFVSSILYINNWWLIFHEVSYFESFGPPSPLGHLWSLAVEEQFYLIAPLLLWLGMRRKLQRGRLLGWVLLLAGISASLMALLYTPGTDPSRVYYGTDTRLFGLLLGSALAIVWPAGRLANHLPRPSYLALEGAGVAGLLIVLAMIWQTTEYGTFLFRGGMVLLSVAAALVIASAAHPATWLGKLLGLKPLRWLGVRSYGIYLWHYPVIVMTRPEAGGGGTDGYALAVIQVAVSIALAALSYRYIEEPIRHGRLQSRLRELLACRTVRLLDSGWMRRGLSSGVLAMLIVMSVSCMGSDKDNYNVSADAPVSEQADRTSLLGSNPAFQPKAENGLLYVPDSRQHLSGNQITAIGDSILLNVDPYLAEKLPGIVTDGKIGRHMKDAAGLLEQLESGKKLGDHIIIELGTNGPFPEKQLEKLLASLGDAKQIVLVNVRVPRKWEDEVNTTLQKAAEQHDHVRLADWYAASEGHEEYFEKDGVHLKPKGAKAYANLLFETLGLSVSYELETMTGHESGT